MTVKTVAAQPSRERVLQAAQDLFAERGSDAVTMADVARAAGVARATVFNQFGSKHALIEAITEGVFAGYQAILERALDDRRTPTPVLVRALFELMGRGIEGDQRFYSAVFREVAKVMVGVDEGGVAQRARLASIERLEQLLMRGQARGELSRAFAPEDLAIAFDSLVYGTISHWLFENSSQRLTDCMLRAADVFLGPVAVAAPGAYDGPPPDLTVDEQAARSRHMRALPRSE